VAEVQPTSEVGVPIGPDDVSNDDYVCERGVSGGAVNQILKATQAWSLWGSSPARENSHGKTGNRTRDFMVIRSSDYQATRLVTSHVNLSFCTCFDVEPVLVQFTDSSRTVS
jgi:hypothetical protein